MVFLYFPHLSFWRTFLWLFIAAAFMYSMHSLQCWWSATRFIPLSIQPQKEHPISSPPSLMALHAAALRIWCGVRCASTSLTATAPLVLLAKLALVFYKAGAVFKKMSLQPAEQGGMYTLRVVV